MKFNRFAILLSLLALILIMLIFGVACSNPLGPKDIEATNIQATNIQAAVETAIAATESAGSSETPVTPETPAVTSTPTIGVTATSTSCNSYECADPNTTIFDSDVSQEDRRTILQLITRGNLEEARSMRYLDISYAKQSFAGNQLALLERSIEDLKEKEIYLVNKFYPAESYVHDVRIVSEGSIISVDTCEYWESSYYALETNDLLQEEEFHLIAQTITIELINGQPFVTTVSFYENVAFCTDEKSAPTSEPVGPEPAGAAELKEVRDELQDFKAVDRDINKVIFSQEQGWLILSGENGYLGSSELQGEFFKDLKELNEEGEEIKHVTFTSLGAWGILYGDSGLRSSGNLPESAFEKFKELNEAEETIKQIEFTPRDGWVILYDRNQASWSDIPKEAADALKNFYEEDQEVNYIAFTPNNGWIILVGENGYSSDGIPGGALAELDKLNDAGETIKQVAFSPDSGWVILYGENDFSTSASN